MSVNKIEGRQAMKPLRLREDLYDKLNRLAKFQDQTMQDALEELLETVDEDIQNEIGMYCKD